MGKTDCEHSNHTTTSDKIALEGEVYPRILDREEDIIVKPKIYHCTLPIASPLDMGNSDSLPSGSRRARRIGSDQGRMWTAALVLASILASQECVPASAFQVISRTNNVHTQNPDRGSSHLEAVAQITSSATDEGKIRAHNVPPPSSTPTRMFLKAGKTSWTPISSLTSDFFDTASTPRLRVGGDDVPIFIPQRKRGILGFALHENDYRSVSSSRPSLSMEDSSTSLHSSTEEQRSSSSGFDLGTWNPANELETFEGSDIVWLAPPMDNNRNPILNRSPSSAYTSESQGKEKASYPAWFPWIPSVTQIEALNVRELKMICADRGLKQTGNKAELQQRLWEWTRTQQHRQRRLMIGSQTDQRRSTERETQTNDDNEETSSTSANSLGEWARTYNIQPLLQRREEIHKEKREGKTVKKEKKPVESVGSPATPTKEYLSKLFGAPSSQYSNLEVKQMYLASKEADKNGERNLAKQILLKLKDATPNDARIYRRLARLETENGNLHLARKILQEGLRMDPSNAHLWHGLGQLEMKAGDNEESKRCWMKAIQANPAFPNPYHALGTMEHSSGEIAKAMKIIKSGLQYCPTNHRLHHALGDLYREAKMLDMAERSYRRALDHGVNEASQGFSYTSLAHVSYERGDLDGCRSWLRKAIALNNGRGAKAWLALAHLEESEGNMEVARSVCMKALNKYEKQLIRRSQKSASGSSKSPVKTLKELESSLQADPVELRNQMLQRVPRYRSGDHFLIVYRNWLRLEKKYGTTESVDDLYKRATTAFPLDWKLSVDWASYHATNGLHDRARLLFEQACDKAGSRSALPYRFFAEFEMNRGNYKDARKILFMGAHAVSDSPDGAFGGSLEAAELFNTWAVCEWHLNNLPRAEVLFDHALRLVSADEKGAALRSHVLYALGLLEVQRGELHLAQHCLCLCLKENAMLEGNAPVWSLWARVASEMGDHYLAEQCKLQSQISEKKVSDKQCASSTAMTKSAMAKLLRKEPWHHKIDDLHDDSSKALPFSIAALPEIE